MAKLEGNPLGAAGEVATHPETWPDFPHDEDGDLKISDAQQKLVEYLAPRLAELRIKLCPGRMSESDFREILFVRLHPEKEDSLILSKSQTVKVQASLSMEQDNSMRGTIGVPDKVVSLAREVIKNPETWLNFPFPDDDKDDDFKMSDAQQEHALAVQHLVPRLARLRTQLCPDHMSESLFWKMYFVRVYPKLEKEDAMLLSTPQLVKAWARAISVEGDILARGVVGVTDEAVSFARDIARYPEAWLDYLLLDDDDDFTMSEIQHEHVLAIKHLAPRLAALRLELCSVHMSESCFWKIYFVHLHPILDTKDAVLLSTSQIVKAWAHLSTELHKIRKTNNMNKEHPVRVPHPQPYPWVMVPHDLTSDSGRLAQTFYSIADKEQYITDYYNISGVHVSEGFSETAGLKVCASCYGWLILINLYNGGCFLLDVASMQKVRLPKLPSQDMVPDDITYGRVSRSYFFMTAPPTVPNCVVGVVLSTRTSFLIWRPGRHKWIELSYDPYMLSHVVVCNQKVYCVVDAKYFGVCDIVDNGLSVRKLGHKFSTRDYRSPISRYLVEVKDDIFSIHVSFYSTCGVDTFHVYKFDKRSEKWIEVDTIDGSAFFLNGAHSFHCKTDSGMVEGNSISFCKHGFLYTVDMPSTNYNLRPLPRIRVQCTRKYPAQFVMLDPQAVLEDFARIGGKFWTGVGVTVDVVSFAGDIARNSHIWLDFPLPDDDFEMSDAQQDHVLAVEHLEPRLDALRMELCFGNMRNMRESRFWKIYFVLVHPILEKEDAVLLSTSQIMRIVEAQIEVQEHTVEVPERGRSLQRDRRP